MPVPAVIAVGAQQYQHNTGFLAKMAGDLTPDEWLSRPDVHSNHIAWIVGHVIWTRKMLLGRLGFEWSRPWLDLFIRGVKIDSSAAYPAPDELLEAWRETGIALAERLEAVSEEWLATPAVKGPPSPDGKESGIINFLAWHETYHIGQVSYVRGWLGKSGLMG